jgi:hypothetical protein
MLGKSMTSGSHSKRTMTIQGEGKGSRPGEWTDDTSLSGTAKNLPAVYVVPTQPPSKR